jgi:hypothetical protein
MHAPSVLEGGRDDDEDVNNPARAPENIMSESGIGEVAPVRKKKSSIANFFACCFALNKD